MSSTDSSLRGARDVAAITSQVPSPTRQTCYFSTGALAGASTIPIELAWQHTLGVKPTAPLSFIRGIGPAAIGRAGTRFWVFDHAKSQLSHSSMLPVWMKGGLGGASGGFAEVCVHSFARGHMPQAAALGAQSLRLFFCFGTYTFLSTSLSDELPPKPFWRCWLMGATAGAVGSAIVARLEGVKRPDLWAKATLKGSLVIGTTIAVHVTSCAALLKAVEE